MNSTIELRRKPADKLLPPPGFLVARGLAWIVVTLIIAVVGWCSWLKIQIAVTATGKLVVRGETIHFSAPEQGVVVETPIQVGQRVRAGDVLVRLDSFRYQSEVKLLELDLPPLRLEQQRHLESAKAIEAVLASLQTRLATTKQEAEFLAHRLDRVQALKKQGIASVEECEQAKSPQLRALADVAQIQAELERSRSEIKNQLRLAAEVAARIESITAKQEHLRALIDRMSIKAEVAGVVSELSIRRPGMTALAGQPLVSLIPEGEKLVARVEIPNRSLRGLTPGLHGRLAVKAFPAQDYGYLECELDAVEPDAKEGGAYLARLNILENRASHPGQQLLLNNLRPGLEVEVELVVDQRRMFDVFLAPLRKFMAEPLTIGRE